LVLQGSWSTIATSEQRVAHSKILMRALQTRCPNNQA
jgi:hypothetical protein